ncbi:MAG TPA: exopolysaccharide biosynthesis protein [Burkholderiaceae bacterium]|nr:exopolysaccharide biosynthesis protein [Burkholderiaceae bacterium]
MSDGIAERLKRAAEHLHADRVPLKHLAEAHGTKAQATLLVLLALPAMLPVSGISLLLAVGIAGLAVAMWNGREDACMPHAVATLELPGDRARRVLRLLAACYDWASRVCRSRWTRLTDGIAARRLSAVVGLMAVLIVLPIPFGNVLPALALVLFGLGLAFRDGMAVVAGMVTALLGTAFCVSVGLAVWVYGREWLQQLAGA